MIIYRLTDRIPVKIGELIFWISPLSYEQKTNLLDCKKMNAGVEVVDGGKRAQLSMKYAIKGIDGLKIHTGEDYKPSFDPDGLISNASIDEITGLDCLAKVVTVCVNLLNGISDPKLEGVEVDFKGAISTEKKA